MPATGVKRTAEKQSEAGNGLISQDGVYVSEAEYWERYYDDPDFKYEWNNGVLEEKPMADFSKAQMYLWFLQLLENYLRVQPIAQVVVLDIGFRLALAEKTSVRRPDLAVIRNDNPVAIAGPDRTYRGIFNLCVESLSDSSRREIERDTVHKKREYAGIGVQEYYILDDRGRHTAFYRRTAWGGYAALEATGIGVIRSEVLPGFQFRVTDLYAQPTLEELASDEVYRGYIWPEYQAERSRAELAQQRAEQERRERELAQQRAERLAAQLRALGVEPVVDEG